MNSHSLARTAPLSRELLVRRVREYHWTVVEVNDAVLTLLDAQNRSDEKDLRLALTFHRPSMLRRLLLRDGRCTCALVRGADVDGPKPWQEPRA
jgi:hypothetical protein